MNKIKRSIKLLQAAFAVLFSEQKLFLFPVIATVLALVIALFFIAPVALYPTGHSYFSAAHWNALVDRLGHSINVVQLQQNKPAHIGPVTVAGSGTLPWFSTKPWVAIFFACAYFASMILATFSNVAFYHEIMQALNGNAVSIRRGFRFALTRWRAVFLWSLFAGLVGYLIQAIQERLGILGRVVTGLIGIVWSVACIFIIPVLVREEQTANPLKLLRSSAGTLKRSWGELVIGFVGLESVFGAIFLTFLLAVTVVAGVSIYFLNTHFHAGTIWIIAASIGIVLLMALVLSWVSSMVNPVYRCALYIYATEGVVPGKFDKELLDSAWKVK
jgi:hypothetical protein